MSLICDSMIQVTMRDTLSFYYGSLSRKSITFWKVTLSHWHMTMLPHMPPRRHITALFHTVHKEVITSPQVHRGP